MPYPTSRPSPACTSCVPAQTVVPASDIKPTKEIRLPRSCCKIADNMKGQDGILTLQSNSPIKMPGDN